MSQKTDTPLPHMPGDWEWREEYAHGVYFGKNVEESGGWLGEVSPYSLHDRTVWRVQINEILSDPTGSGKDTRISEQADTTKQFDTKEEAIEAVPEIVGTYYP